MQLSPEHLPQYEVALALMISSGKASPTFLQRQMGIKLPIAQTLIEYAEYCGVISEPDDLGKRIVFLNYD